MKESATNTKIAPAMIAAASDLGPIAKDAINPAFRSRYSTLDAIMAEVRPILAKNGLAVMQGVVHPETTDEGKLVGLTVETRIIHASGEWVSCTVPVPVNKADAHGAGSAISYGRRYGLSAMLGLTSGDPDDDGNAAVAAAPRVTNKPLIKPTDEPKRMFESVPTTPRAKAFDGNVEAAMAYPFPFKKSEHHGKPLGELSEAVLLSTAKWCRETDADKFADLLARIEAVVHFYNDNEATNDKPDDLPF